MSVVFPRRHSSRRLSRRAALIAGVVAPAALAAGGSVAAAQDATPASSEGSGFSADEQLAMAAIVADALAATATPGALVGVWHPDRGTWLHAAGVGDLATAAPIALDDHVRIASITKTYVATVVLQLADEGLLGLDDVLETYVTGVPNGGEITIRQLLAMSAGIYDYVRDPVIAVDYAVDPMIPFEPEDALAIIRAGTPDFAPGEGVRYCNSNYMLLGMIVEQVAGQPVEDAVTERLIVPLELAGTSFATTPEMPEPFARGYNAASPGDPLQDLTRSNPGVAWAAGANISTLEDLNAWARALGTGALLSPEIFAERLQWGSLATTPVQVNYGLGILQINGLVGHNGGIPGYSSWMVYDPDEDATLVVVTNRGGESGGTSDPIFYGLAGFLFPDRFPPAPAATPAG